MNIENYEIVHLLNRLSTLKRLRRTGWVVKNIPNPESIGDHVFRVTFMAMLLGDMANFQGGNMNVEKLMKIAQIHEIGEALLGDLHLGAKKLLDNDCISSGERKAVAELCDKIGELGQEYIALWEEFEHRKSPEGKFIRGIDKLEMMITAWEYESLGYLGLDEFFQGPDNAGDITDNPLLSQIYKVLLEKRAQKN